MLLIQVSYSLTVVIHILLIFFHSYWYVPLHAYMYLFLISVHRFAHSFQWL